MKKKLGTKTLLRKSFVLIQKLQLDAKLGTPTNRAIYNYVHILLDYSPEGKTS